MSSENARILGFAGIWLLAKLAFLGLGKADMGFHAGVLLNMFFLVLLPFLALRRRQREGLMSEGFLPDLKAAIRPGAKYALLISFAVFSYYKWIDPGFSSSKIEEAITQLHEQLPDEAAYASIQAEEATLKNVSYEDYIKKNEDGIALIYSPGMQTGASLVALVFSAVFYGLLITVFHRKLLLKL